MKTDNKEAPADSFEKQQQALDVYGVPGESWDVSTLTICIVGASGDLAKKKILPALFALFDQGMLPPRFRVFGYARSKMTHEEFRSTIASLITCRAKKYVENMYLEDS